jgi:fructose-1,6-bisphosphatase/inositol monophosphatase family enzyme
MQLTQILNEAEHIVQEAGSLVKKMRDEGRVQEFTKSNGSPVTNADKAGEDYIKQGLDVLTPEYSFLGEETGYTAGKNGRKWLCDPIDGTRSFKNGKNDYTATIALQEGSKTLGGIIVNPETGETYRSCDNEVPTKNGVPMSRTTMTDLRQATVSYSISTKRADARSALEQAVAEGTIGNIAKSSGSVAYRLAQVAEGASQAYVSCQTTPVNPWDIAAGVHIIESNGGRVTGGDGKPLADSDYKELLVAAANPELHNQLLAYLRQTVVQKPVCV